MAEFELDDKHLAAAGIETDTGDANANDQQVSQTDTATQGGSDTVTQSTTQQTDKVEGAVGKDSLSGKPDGGTQQGKEKQGQGAADPELKTGDIRLQDGTIVRAGAERRHYENARLFKQESTQLKNDLNTANQRYNTLQEKYSTLETTVKQIGMEDATQVASAVRLYKDLGSNPVQTVTKLLAELKAAGHTFDGIGGAVDTLAIQHALDARLPPANQGPTPEQLQRQAQEDGAREAQEFLTNFPDAMMHEDTIANIVQAEFAAGREPNLRDVYFKLRQSVIQHGLDWSQPLAPQIAARKAAPQPTPKPIVNGRGAVVEGHSENIDPFKSASGDTKDSIILAAMKEGGYNYAR